MIGVLEKGSEIRCLIEKTHCGLVCDPENYQQIEKNVNWFIENAGSQKIADMGRDGYEFFKSTLTKDVSITKYIYAIKSI